MKPILPSSLLLIAVGCSRTSGSTTSTLTFDISPDGQSLLYVNDADGRVFLTHGGAKPTQVAEGDAATLLKDGSVIVSIRAGAEYRLRRVKNGVTQDLFAKPGTQDTQPAAVGNGVAFVRSLRSRPYSFGGTVQTDYVLMFSTLDGTPRPLCPKPFSSMVLLPHCDDGRYVYFSGAPSVNDAEAIYRLPLTGGGEPERIVKLTTLESVTVSPERGLIAFTDRTTPEVGITYSVKIARTDGSQVKVVSHEAAEQLVCTDHGRSVLILREPKLDGHYDLETLDLSSGKTIRKVRLKPTPAEP